MFTLMLGLSATGIAASVGVGLAASRRKQRKLRLVLGLPATAADGAQGAQIRRVMREYEATAARIRERSPHLSEAQCRELAVNLVRARGLLPAGSARVH
jgi:hypothetical protein